MNPTSLLRLSPILLAALAPLAAQAKLDLRVSAPKGTTAWFQSKTKMESSIDMGGQQMEMGNETTHTFALEIVDVAADGTLTANVKFLRIHGSMTVPMMGDIDFDSATPSDDDDEGPGAIGNGMVALAGKTFAITVAKNGEVQEVKGVKEALAEARKKAGRMGAQMLGGSLNEGALKRQIEGLFGKLPAEPTAVGGKWQRETNQASHGVPVATASKYTLAKADDATLELSIEGTVSTATAEKAAAKPAENGKAEARGGDDDDADSTARQMMEKMKISNGKIAGKEVVARKDGLVQRSESTMSMDMSMPSPMGGGDMSITQKTTMVIERSTKDAAEGGAKPKAEDKKAEDKKGEDKKGEKKGDGGK
ncbi:MAG TPA: DUF6263 family protein [Planctomycetota bacterium]|nr:DUF6263 family protein [Planctomycetota bacterium]